MTKEDEQIFTVSYRKNKHVFPDKPIEDRTAKYPPSFLQLVWGYTHAMIMVHYFLWSIAMFMLVFLLWFFNHPYLAIACIIAYLPSFLRPDQFNTGRPWPAFRRSKQWWFIQEYLGVELVRTAKLDTSKQYVFGLHPHGILILSRPSMYGGGFEALFEGIDLRVLGASPMFWVPGARELCLWLDAINAAKSVAMKALRAIVPKTKYNHSGKLSLMVFPGGSKEIFTTDPNSRENVVIARKGFIKLAVQSGCDLVPGFVFGEKWVYNRKFLPKVIMDFFMNTLKTPLILFFGQYYTWIPLQRSPLTVVFGKPISVVQQEDPSDEYIDELFQQFYGQITSIFEEHKGKLGYSSDETLIIKEQKDNRKDKKNE